MNPPPEPWRYEYRMSGHIRVMPDFSGFDGAIKGAFQQVSSSLEDAALRMGSLSKTMQGVADAFANMPEINVEGFKPLGYLSENGIE